jgi:hypothetical protein
MAADRPSGIRPTSFFYHENFSSQPDALTLIRAAPDSQSLIAVS